MPLGHYLVLSGLLFAIGSAGVFLRRNLITLLLSIEIMLNAVNLAFVAFGRQFGTASTEENHHHSDAVAAAEAAVALPLAHNPHDCSNHDSTVAEACAGINRLSRGAGLVALSADGTTAGHAPAGHTDRAVVMTQATGSAPPSAAPPVLRI